MVQKEAREAVAETPFHRLPTHCHLSLYTLQFATHMHAPSFCLLHFPNPTIPLLLSKNLFIDNLPSMPRLNLIVRIELRCLLRVEFLTAHKT